MNVDHLQMLPYVADLRFSPPVMNNSLVDFDLTADSNFRKAMFSYDVQFWYSARNDSEVKNNLPVYLKGAGKTYGFTCNSKSSDSLAADLASGVHGRKCSQPTTSGSVIYADENRATVEMVSGHH